MEERTVKKVGIQTKKGSKLIASLEKHLKPILYHENILTMFLFLFKMLAVEVLPQ